LEEELEEDAINWLLGRPRKPWKQEESFLDDEDRENESYAIITSVKPKGKE
jgi:hypothetical protein